MGGLASGVLLVLKEGDSGTKEKLRGPEGATGLVTRPQLRLIGHHGHVAMEPAKFVREVNRLES